MISNLCASWRAGVVWRGVKDLVLWVVGGVLGFELDGVYAVAEEGVNEEGGVEAAVLRHGGAAREWRRGSVSGSSRSAGDEAKLDVSRRAYEAGRLAYGRVSDSFHAR